VGGWGNVFRTRLPRWASRIRNYFNETPLALKRVDDWLAGELLARLQMGLNELNRAKMTKWLKKWNVSKSLPRIKRLPDPKPGNPDPLFLDDIGETFALSGDVYLDQYSRFWFQMSPGGTIYHWGKKPGKWMADHVGKKAGEWSATAEAILQSGGQRFIPVFKL